MSDPLTPSRRAALAQIAALIGASSLPLEALAAPKAKAKRFLSKARFALLGVVSDTLIPHSDSAGALDAKVPARLDGLLLNWAAPDTRTNIVGALDRIEAAARAQTGKVFGKLAPAERESVLRAHDASALKKAPPPANAPKPNFFVQPDYVVDPGYLTLKGLVLDLYYFSPEGSATELVYDHVPGKFQPSIKLTPNSRPELGTGPF